jgi:hypothetical protein
MRARETFPVRDRYNFGWYVPFLGLRILISTPSSWARVRASSEVVPKVVVVSKRLGQDLCNRYLLIEGDFLGGSFVDGLDSTSRWKGAGKRNFPKKI